MNEVCVYWLTVKYQDQESGYETLTHFSPVSHLYTPWKRRFEGHWTKMEEELLAYGSTDLIKTLYSPNVYLFCEYIW